MKIEQIQNGDRANSNFNYYSLITRIYVHRRRLKNYTKLSLIEIVGWPRAFPNKIRNRFFSLFIFCLFTIIN